MGLFNFSQEKEIVSEYWLARVETLGRIHQEATTRSRQSILFSVVASCLILICLFNRQLTWDRHIDFENRPDLIYNYHLSPNYQFFERIYYSIHAHLIVMDKEMLENYYRNNMLAGEKLPDLSHDVFASKITNFIINRAAYAPPAVYYPFGQQSHFPTWDPILKDAKALHLSPALQAMLEEAVILRPDLDAFAKECQDKFFDRHRLAVPILGILISYNDLCTVGCFSLLLLMIWSYLCNIRQISITRDVYKMCYVLRQDQKLARPELNISLAAADHLIHILSFNMIHSFILSTISDDYLYGLGDLKKADREKDYNQRWGGKLFARYFPYTKLYTWIMRRVSEYNLFAGFLQWLPVITTVCIFGDYIGNFILNSFLSNVPIHLMHEYYLMEFCWLVCSVGLLLLTLLNTRIDEVLKKYQEKTVELRRTIPLTQFNRYYDMNLENEDPMGR